MKKAIILLSLAAICCSCGASKKVKTKEEIKEVVTDQETTDKKSTDSTKIDKSVKISIDSFTNTYSFEPFDSSKPYFINGKEYVNVKVIEKKETTNYKEDLKQLEQRYLNELESNYKEYRKEIESLKTAKDKEVKEPVMLYLIIIFIILIVMYVVWKKIKIV